MLRHLRRSHPETQVTMPLHLTTVQRVTPLLPLFMKKCGKKEDHGLLLSTHSWEKRELLDDKTRVPFRQVELERFPKAVGERAGVGS